MLSLTAAIVPTVGAAAAATCAGSAPSDFNGDGISDVAIGEPQSGVGAEGLVHVLYGTRSGLHTDATSTTPNDQLITTNATGGADFGERVVALDFNGDHCADLAVAASLATVDGQNEAGFVAVYFGSPQGLVLSDPLFITGDEQSDGEFGSSLAAGNFNGDAFTDLVVGEPDDDPDGAAYIFAGSPTIQAAEKRVIPGQGGVPDGDGTGDRFGDSVAVGDFNGDGDDDLAIGADGFKNDSGAVVVMNGSGDASMLADTGGTRWTQDTAVGSVGIAGTAEKQDGFGFTLAAGDFNGDNRSDLAVGVPEEKIGSTRLAGMVNVIYSGGAGGLTVVGNQGWTRNSPGVSGTVELGGIFGVALAAGDFDNNGKTDLAIGAPGFDGSSGGSVNVLMGSSAGLSTSGQQLWSQGSPGIAGTPEASDEFGLALGTARIHSSNRDDLIVGVPFESIGTVQFAGEIQVIPASKSGLTATGSQTFSAGTAGLQGSLTTNGEFGTGLS